MATVVDPVERRLLVGKDAPSDVTVDRNPLELHRVRRARRNSGDLFATLPSSERHRLLPNLRHLRRLHGECARVGKDRPRASGKLARDAAHVRDTLLRRRDVPDAAKSHMDHAAEPPDLESALRVALTYQTRSMNLEGNVIRPKP